MRTAHFRASPILGSSGSSLLDTEDLLEGGRSQRQPAVAPAFRAGTPERRPTTAQAVPDPPAVTGRAWRTCASHASGSCFPCGRSPRRLRGRSCPRPTAPPPGSPSLSAREPPQPRPDRCGFHRYYSLIRLLHSVRHRLRIHPFLCGPVTTSGQNGDLPGPGNEDVRTCMGSSTPWSPTSPHHIGDVGVAFDRRHSLGSPDKQPFDAPLPCPSAPLSTLHLPPRDDRRMTRGESGG